ncbi:alpha/beta fold hydrolase [Mycobacterium sp.]|uniref:alpha/beta hydrolase family protein n=1 Tax=Mycobacterium sp. TaxID=1785 RepID=UPI0031D9020F
MTSDAAPDPLGALPDSSGGDVRAGGLPPRSSLSPRQRLVVDASALGDVAVRTAVASMLGVAMAPAVGAAALHRAESQRERDNLAFYAALAAEHDAAKSFPAPTARPRVTARRANPLAERVAHGKVENISFTSSFEAVNPSVRSQWHALSRNNVVQAQHWRHDDGPRPTLCVIHGFLGSAYLLNGRFFSLPWYYRAGYDVLLYTLPFHGRRGEKYSPFSGYGYFAHGLTGFAEAMAQAVHDFRTILDYLRHTGVDRIALTGVSLGGYTASLIAAVDDRLEAVIPNCPVVAPHATFDEWFPANKVIALGLRLADISWESLVAGLAYHCPLNYQPVVARERRLIITGLGDRFAPPRQAEMLWQHWDHCLLHWFPGSHLLHINKADYLRRMTQFLQEFMFG